MTTEEMLDLFNEGKLSIILSNNDEEIEALSDFLECRGYHPYELSTISAYIRDCLGPRQWPNICIGSELEIQGCGSTFVEDNMEGQSVSIEEFLAGDLHNEDVSMGMFDDMFSEV